MATEVARRGDTVVGTVRRREQFAGLEADGISPLLLDVTDVAQVDAGVASAVATLGGLDVIVNNAGFALVGAIEAVDEDEFRGIMETNFFGALRVTRAALPVLRAGGGAVINITSVAGLIGLEGMGAYCASKFALEGFSESLALELAPFGVKVMIVEPGSFRTEFAGRSSRVARHRVDAYAGTLAGEIGTLMREHHGQEPGDPAKAIEVILAALDAETVPLHLVLGADALRGIDAKLGRLTGELDEWRARSAATGF